MSESAKIILVGEPKANILDALAKIKMWDNAHDYPIIAVVNGKEKYDSIENIEKAVNRDLASYIEKNFANKNLIVKSGGNDDLYLVANPSAQDITPKKKFRKVRNPMTNFTPKKRKRK